VIAYRKAFDQVAPTGPPSLATGQAVGVEPSPEGGPVFFALSKGSIMNRLTMWSLALTIMSAGGAAGQQAVPLP